ncbi:MAG: TetR/AcrR family transcriptional regulator [Chloroflexi bacterium CFX4]|nr:TetR/AcrR family transcriptional regulator [Chloroflexi bacterium CFX4]MDL1924038.1 TetR/AcrR family transcriptional regulator [Chloroflexi bacterium CFX3]
MNDALQPLNLKEERRLQLLDAATELLAKRPTASLAEIAEHTRISKATLHRYFASRDALLTALAVRALALVSAALADCRLSEGAAPAALRRLIEALIPLGDKFYFLLNEHLWNVHPDLVAAEQATEVPIMQLIQRGQAEGSLRADLPVAWIMYTLEFTVFAAWQAIYDGNIARRDAAHLVLESLLGGIIAKA